MSERNKLTLHVVLTDAEAWDLAQFVKRLGYSDCRNNAGDENEARRMMAVCEKIRRELGELGYAPR